MKKLTKTPIVSKKVIEVEEIVGHTTELNDDGKTPFESALGKEVLIFCMNYIYAGTLSGINGTQIMLTDASIVYETGAFTSKNYTEAQKLPFAETFLNMAAIESWGVKV